jgi:hypothetical protein
MPFPFYWRIKYSELDNLLDLVENRRHYYLGDGLGGASRSKGFGAAFLSYKSNDPALSYGQS